MKPWWEEVGDTLRFFLTHSMLHADKAHLEAWTRVSLLTIREKEIKLYATNSHNLGTIAAIVAGIAYFGLLYVKMPYFREAADWQKAAYGLTMVGCLGISLRVCFGTTMILMFGPGTALRADNNGMFHGAVEGMRIEFEHAGKHLYVVIHGTLLIVVFFAWGKAVPHWIGSVILTFLALAASSLIVRQTRALDKAFPLRSLNLTSGAFYSKDRREVETREAEAGSSVSQQQQQQQQPQRQAQPEARQVRSTAKGHDRRHQQSAELL